MLSGNRPEDLHCPPAPPEPFVELARRETGPLRIALSTRIPWSIAPAQLDPEIRAQVERLAGVLASLGHEVELADPSYGLVGASFMPRSTPGVRAWAERNVADHTQLDSRTLGTIRLGRLLGPLLRFAHAVERPVRAHVGRIFQRYDVVLMPTTAQPPRPIGSIDGRGDWETDKVMVGACPYTWPWNVIGWPGVNVPAGFTADGLPIGAQLLGPANSEPLLLALAAQLEAVERWTEQRPPELAERTAALAA